MTEYDNTNKGILSRNDRRESDSHPEFKGQININGTEYWLSGWVKERKDGTGKFFSLSAKLKDGQSIKPKPASDDFDDENLPF